MISSYRYVEVAYDLPGVDLTQFRAWIDVAVSPDAALAAATEDCLQAHPDATNVVEFMQRAVTPERGAEIEAEILAKTWTGWRLSKDRGLDEAMREAESLIR